MSVKCTDECGDFLCGGSFSFFCTVTSFFSDFIHRYMNKQLCTVFKHNLFFPKSTIYSHDIFFQVIDLFGFFWFIIGLNKRFSVMTFDR